jgi:hypothetical protein
VRARHRIRRAKNDCPGAFANRRGKFSKELNAYIQGSPSATAQHGGQAMTKRRSEPDDAQRAKESPDDAGAKRQI